MCSSFNNDLVNEFFIFVYGVVAIVFLKGGFDNIPSSEVQVLIGISSALIVLASIGRLTKKPNLYWPFLVYMIILAAFYLFAYTSLLAIYMFEFQSMYEFAKGAFDITKFTGLLMVFLSIVHALITVNNSRRRLILKIGSEKTKNHEKIFELLNMC